VRRWSCKVCNAPGSGDHRTVCADRALRPFLFCGVCAEEHPDDQPYVVQIEDASSLLSNLQAHMFSEHGGHEVSNLICNRICYELLLTLYCGLPCFFLRHRMTLCTCSSYWQRVPLPLCVFSRPSEATWYELASSSPQLHLPPQRQLLRQHHLQRPVVT
jgi:hypothetical protein